MRIRWRGLELPTRLERDSLVSTDKYGKFYIEPFERCFGTTIGNSLRRVLLSSLEGSAVTSVKISGVDHEFTSIKGVMEDVTDIIGEQDYLFYELGDDPLENGELVYTRQLALGFKGGGLFYVRTIPLFTDE